MTTSEKILNQYEELSGSEALFGFAGWLTTRKEKTIMSATTECGSICDLIMSFCGVNKLKEPRKYWHKELKHPV